MYGGSSPRAQSTVERFRNDERSHGSSRERSRVKFSEGPPTVSCFSPFTGTAQRSSEVGRSSRACKKGIQTAPLADSGIARAKTVPASGVLARPKHNPITCRQTPLENASAALAGVIRSLQDIEDGARSGAVEVEGQSLAVTNLNKVFFPKKKLTKGDLMRYYATVAPFVLPVMKDRPLVLKRFPNGVTSDAFFQQNAGETPDGVRVETIRTEGGSTNLRIAGGDLYTLLYTVQLGAVSVDPWHSRIQIAQSLDSRTTRSSISIRDREPRLGG